MPFRFVIAAVAVPLALAACATAPLDPAAPATLRAGDIAPDGTAVSCRTIERIGTRFGERTCKSEAAWNTFDGMMAKNAKEATDKYQRVGSGSATSAGN